MRISDFEVFLKKFSPVEKSPGDFLFETYGKEYELVLQSNPFCVWTLLDSDGKLYIAPGLHWINRQAYFITKNPWSERQRDYRY